MNLYFHESLPAIRAISFSLPDFRPHWEKVHCRLENVIVYIVQASLVPRLNGCQEIFGAPPAEGARRLSPEALQIAHLCGFAPHWSGDSQLDSTSATEVKSIPFPTFPLPLHPYITRNSGSLAPMRSVI